MARPKRSDGLPSAKEKIETEFWELYKQKPIEKITVKEVCAAAECNKTTFYYYYQDLRAVLETIEEDCLPLEAPDMLVELLYTDDNKDKKEIIMGHIENMGKRFERYCLLLSSKGDPNFVALVEKIMAQKWQERLGVEYASLSDAAQLSVKFVIGGAISLFAECGEDRPFDVDAFSDVVINFVLPATQSMLAKERITPPPGIETSS